MAALVPTPAAASVSDESAFIAQVNQTRAAQGLPPLQPDSQLTNLARNWATAMKDGTCGAGNFICHASPISAGVTHPWAKLGENVGTGPEVNSVMKAFIASPGHYANIIDPEFTHIGVGVVWDGSRMYTTHRFMKLQTPPATTTTTTVPPTTTTAAPPTTTTTAPAPSPTTTTAPSPVRPVAPTTTAPLASPAPAPSSVSGVPTPVSPAPVSPAIDSDDVEETNTQNDGGSPTALDNTTNPVVAAPLPVVPLSTERERQPVVVLEDRATYVVTTLTRIINF